MPRPGNIVTNYYVPKALSESISRCAALLQCDRSDVIAESVLSFGDHPVTIPNFDSEFQMTVSIPKEVRKTIRRRSADYECSNSAFVCLAVTEYLKSATPELVPELLSA